MAREHDREMTLSDGREVLVDFTVESYGSDPSGTRRSTTAQRRAAC